MRKELAFSRRPGGKLNGAEPNGSSASAAGGLGDTAAGTTAGAVKAVVAVAFGPAPGTHAKFCSVGVSVDVVDADFAVIPVKGEKA